jgi:hypothetical protein
MVEFWGVEKRAGRVAAIPWEVKRFGSRAAFQPRLTHAEAPEVEDFQPR